MDIKKFLMDTIFSDFWSIGHSIQTPRGSGNSIIVSEKAHKEFQMLITKENLLQKIYFQKALNTFGFAHFLLLTTTYKEELGRMLHVWWMKKDLCSSHSGWTNITSGKEIKRNQTVKNISRTFSMSDKVKFRACCKFWVVTLPGSDQRPICLQKGKHAGDEGKYKRCSNPCAIKSLEKLKQIYDQLEA